MMRLVVGATLALVGGVEGRISLLKSKLGHRLRRAKPLVTQTNAWSTAEQACCSCFKSKYAWPSNAGLGAAFAPKQTCDTCYVTDIYGIESKAPISMSIPRPDEVGSGSAGQGQKQCMNMCDDYPHPGCFYNYQAPGSSEKIYKEFKGEGACDKLIADPLFVKMMAGDSGTPICDTVVGEFCQISCKTNGCGADGAYDVVSSSKVQAVHEWNWNCASGKAPEDAAAWMSGPVEGEPESTRAPFLMCKELDGWYCPNDDGPDMRLAQGKTQPKEFEGSNSVVSVATMSLPVIDVAQSVSQSVSN